MRPLPRSFSVQSLQNFVASLQEELLLCPVRSLREYLGRTVCVSLMSVSRNVKKMVFLSFCQFGRGGYP